MQVSAIPTKVIALWKIAGVASPTGSVGNQTTYLQLHKSRELQVNNY
jgi:hypothetical protein